MRDSLADQDQKKEKDYRTPYEPPAIIYKGKISTRAGSPLAAPDGDTTVIDPADLFGDP
jgi:hypothetical protein